MDGSVFEDLYNEFEEQVKGAAGRETQFTVEFLNRNIPHYNWVGIYMVEGNDLVLRAFSGPKETEHTRIRIGDGLCGLAAKEELVVIVPDVSKDTRYISCFPETKSEIVVPMFRDGGVVGEIDIDSDFVDPFTDDDKHFLERIINLIGRRT